MSPRPWLHGRAALRAAHAADRALFRRAGRLRPRRTDRWLRAISTGANRGVLWAAVGLLLASEGRAGRRAALRGLVPLGLASAVVNVPAKLAFGRVRPDLTPVSQARRLARLPTSGSFPSGHAASAAAFTTGVWLEAPRRALPVAALAATVAYSRVHTGAHYPGDVVAGAAMGVGAALTVRRWWPAAVPGPAVSRTRGPNVILPEGDGLVVVVNAEAAHGDQVADRIRVLLPRATCRVVVEGEALGDALRSAAGDAHVLGVAGGDGSVNTAAAVAHDAGLPLAVFPAGTLNHFAADLGLETLEAAADAVGAGCTMLVDVGEIDGQPFLNSATIGSYPEFVAARETLEDRIGKSAALLVGAVRVLRTADPVDVRLDGESRRVWLVFAGNCRHEPSGFAPRRRARLDDGVLDVRIVDGGPRAGVRLLLAVLTRHLRRSRLYEEVAAEALEVRSDRPLSLSRDGEVFEGSTAFRIAKRSTPLAVVAPAPPA